MSLPKAFAEGLQAALEKRQAIGQTFSLAPAVDKSITVDFASNDTLSMVSSGSLREEVFRELDRNSGFEIGACGSRVNEGTPYVAELEKYLARVHGAEDGLFFVSGYTANSAIFGTLPRQGDAIIYDSLEASPLINSGDRTVFVAIESIYGMDGDIAPAREIIDVTKKALPLGNYVMIIDEAHSNGLLGPQGAGFVSELGLEKEFAIRLQVCGKAHGASGAIVLCHPLVKQIVINYARMFIFTAAPGFLLAATVKAAYNVLTGAEGDARRRKLQENVRFFYVQLEKKPQWHEIKQRGVLRTTCGGSWENDAFRAPIIPFVTQVGKCMDLRDSLRQNGFLVHAAKFPAVPKDSERVRIVIHEGNTQDQMIALVDAIIDWASQQMARDSSTSLSISRPRL